MTEASALAGRDNKRESRLWRAQGSECCVFWNEDVVDNLVGVIETITRHL